MNSRTAYNLKIEQEGRTHPDLDKAITAAEQHFYDAAIEIGRDDDTIHETSFEQFCRVMWSDDTDMKERGMSREDYRHALQLAWEKIHV